jgi:hypothetical protein
MKAAAGLCLLFVATLVVAGCGGSSAAPTESAGTFMTRVLREELSGQWAKQWTELHPGHKKLISRAEYVACSRALATNIGTGSETYKVLAIKDDPIDVYAVPQHDSKVVTITFHSPLSRSDPRYQLHAVDVDGHWTWILGGRFLSQVERGRCLDGTPLEQFATGVQS